jgi:hypothetical protein
MAGLENSRQKGSSPNWSRLARNRKAEIAEEKIVPFRGMVSLPFKPGWRIAVKILLQGSFHQPLPSTFKS